MVRSLDKVYYILVYALLPVLLPARPTAPSAGHDNYDKNLEDYLTQFGYLPTSSANSMRSQNQLANAVKNLQFFAGLNVTGLIDGATIDLMARYSASFHQ
jgi:uncharacterized protein (DUF924 family)